MFFVFVCFFLESLDNHDPTLALGSDPNLDLDQAYDLGHAPD